jgi:hypothetical protein
MIPMPRQKNRQKLSTTIAPESAAFLQAEVQSGRAASTGQALDRVLAAVRRSRRRAELAKRTADYFAGIKPRARKQEEALEAALGALADEVEFEE